MDKQDNNEIPYVEVFNGIDFKGLIRKLMDEYKVILKWCGVAAILALIVGFSIPKKYTVVSRMSLETSSGGVSTGGTLSSLAGLAGINLGSLTSSGDVMSPELYPEILSSTPFVLELFPKTVQFKDKKGQHDISFYEYVRDYMKKPWWNAVIRFPATALGWTLGLFQPKEDKKESESEELDFSAMDPSHLSMEQFGVAGEIRNNIVWSVDKKTSVIRLSASAQNPDVAMQISGDIIKLLQEYLINYRTEKARRDLDYYQQLYDEAKADYYSIQQRYASFLDRNQSIITQRGKAEQDRLRNEMQLSYSLYTSCSQQVQAAKAKVQLDTPVFNVIDPPQYPFMGKPRKIILLVAFIFFGAILSALWILWLRDAIASLRRDDKKEESATDAAPKEEESQA